MTITLEVATLPIESDWWSRGALEWIRTRARSGVPFQGADLISALGEPEHRNHVGAAIARGQALGIIRPTGRRVRSTSPGANGRKVEEWGPR